MTLPTFYWQSQPLHTTAISLQDAFFAARDVMRKAGLQNIEKNEFDVSGTTATCRAAITYFQIGERFIAMIMVAGDDAQSVLKQLSDGLNHILWL